MPTTMTVVVFHFFRCVIQLFPTPALVPPLAILEAEVHEWGVNAMGVDPNEWLMTP